MVVALNQEDIELLDRIIEDIVKIQELDLPSTFEKKKICKKCAYYNLCMI